MLAILRSVPVGQYLQPIGNWSDGLDLPFIMCREEACVSVQVGHVEIVADECKGMLADNPQLVVCVDGAVVECKQAVVEAGLGFHLENPLAETFLFAVDKDKNFIQLDFCLRSAAGIQLANADYLVKREQYYKKKDSLTNLKLDLCKPGSNATEIAAPAIDQLTRAKDGVIGNIAINLRLTWPGSESYTRDDHPLCQHLGGRSGISCDAESHTWKPLQIPVLHDHEQVRTEPAEDWKVPSPTGHQPQRCCH
jgi:hypothetical protein